MDENDEVEEGTRVVPPQHQNLAGSKPVHHASYLKKQNRFGFWQKRFFELNGDELHYYSDENKRKPRKSSKVEFGQLDDRFGGLTLTTETRDFVLYAPNVDEAQDWIQAVEMAEAQADEIEILKEHAAKQSSAPPPVILQQMEGYLQMQSASRVKGWKDRFFRLENTALFYYKDSLRSAEDFSGKILLHKMRVDVGKKGVFKLVGDSETRTFVFKAPTVDSAQDWIKAIEQRLALPRKQGGAGGNNKDDDDEEELEEKDEEIDPKWIIDWDAALPEHHVISIQSQMDHLFPPKGTDLQRTLNAITVLMEELEDKARECLPVGGNVNALTESGRQVRPDIFQFLLRFYHIRIVDELSQFVSLDQEYEKFSIRELLNLMDLISAYDAKLEEILVGEVGEVLRENIPPFGMMDNAENMGQVYLKKCEEQIQTWVEHAVNEVTCERRVDLRVDGRFQTGGPALLFNLLNEALVLAKRSGMKRLQSEVISYSAVSLGDYLSQVNQDLMMEKHNFGYAVACCNDCWSVIDHLENNLKREIRANDAFTVNFDSVEERCAQFAEAGLEVLSNMVQRDLTETLNRCFTLSHLDNPNSNTMAIVCATLDDYLEDFTIRLESPYLFRIAKKMFKHVVGDYLARFGQAFREEGLKTLSLRQREVLLQDRSRLERCAEARLDPTLALLLVQQEFAPLDFVLEMISGSPAFIPPAAVKLAKKQEAIRDHIKEVAKMLIELTASPDEIKEVKTLLETAFLANKAAPVVEMAVEPGYPPALALMWPIKKKQTPATKPTLVREGSISNRNDAKMQLLLETKPSLRQESENTERAKQSMLLKQQSVQWSPSVASPGGMQMHRAMEEDDGPVIKPATLESVMQFAVFGNGGAHTLNLCMIREVDDEFELIVFKGKTMMNPIAFQAKVSEIVGLEFWKDNRAMCCAGDGVSVPDTRPMSTRMANAKKEFALSMENRKKKQVGHFIANTEAEATKWVVELQQRLKESKRPFPVPTSAVKSTVFQPPPVAVKPVAAVATTVAPTLMGQDYSSMTAKQLKDLGKKRNLDMSSCVEKADLVRILQESDGPGSQPPPAAAPLGKTVSTTTTTAPPPAPPPKPIIPPPVVVVKKTAPPPPPPVQLDSQEQKIVEIQTMVFQGHALIEDGNPKEAVALFKEAKRLADEIDDVQLKAKSNAGLATAYRDMPKMRRAAAPLFEVAATLFGNTGDTSDRINVLSEAADIYVSNGEYQQAIRCLTRYDKSITSAGGEAVFAERIREIQKLAAPV